MANKAGIINADTGAIVGVPDALVQVGGVWTIAATAPGTVPASRQINTTAPLTGGGDLSADRTLSIAAATAGNNGYMTSTQVATLATAASTASTAQTTANAALPKAGGTMTGAIDMGNQKITSLGAPGAATDAATKGYVDTAVVGLLDLKGTIDCSTNPNYPAADKGDVYVVSVAGLIGGASGVSVQAGDALVALADNAGGTQAAVGSSWGILQANLIGALLAVNNLSDVQDVVTARSNLGLGSAATQSTSAFATAAQGTLASTAVQRAGDTMTGALAIGASGTATNLELNRSGTAPSTGDASIFRINATIAAVTNGDLYAFKYDPTFTKAASGVHTYFLSMNLQPPTISGGAATVTNAATLFVANQPSGATNNYAVWVAAGQSRLQGKLTIDGTISNQSDGSVMRFAPTYTPSVGADAYCVKFDPTITKAASGTHAYVLTLNLQPPVLSGGAATVTNAATLFVAGAPTGANNNYAAYVTGGLTRLDGTFQLGSSGTALSQMRVYTPTLTPAAVGTGAPTEQTFTVTGLATSDTITVNAPGAAVFSARVSAANTLALTFMPAGTGTYTPPAGTYRIVAVRS